MNQPAAPTFLEQFRRWYEYEKDCNAKTIAMLESVPVSARSDPAFARAMGKMGHLIIARQMWLHRLGHWHAKPTEWFPVLVFDELKSHAKEIEGAWTTYLANLTEADLFKPIEFVGSDGKRRRWRLLDLLTQVFGHAWYHRGQVALLVKDLGGAPVNTDYIFWDQPTVLD
ncbi:MAG: DinB family protein [Phycisphaerales bacterium]